MTTGIILTIVTLAILLALLIFIKVKPVRKSSLEGIEDVQAAQEMIKTANKNALPLGFQGRVEFQEGNIRSSQVS
jgi:F0F1-type ATP synthase membrane subunit b/b'